MMNFGKIYFVWKIKRSKEILPSWISNAKLVIFCVIIIIGLSQKKGRKNNLDTNSGIFFTYKYLGNFILGL